MLATPLISLARKSANRTNVQYVLSSVSNRNVLNARRITATKSKRTVNKRLTNLHFLRCPNCGKESTVKVCDNTVLLNFPFSCPHCGASFFINYVESTAVVINKKVVRR